MRKFSSTFAVAAALCALPAASYAQTVLKASHQFPGGKGDARDEMVQIIAREAKAANVGLDIQVYPGASLFKPNDQWNAMVNGQLDISSFPLDYASGKVGAFSATLMPALVRNHHRATRLNGAPFMKEVKAKIDNAGVVVLADAWLAGAVASKKACIRTPDDIKGLKIRSAGPTFAAMWQQAGASIVSVPSNEVYNALQTGVADATDTSTGSFVSFRIYEQVKCITAPGDNALWFMYEPVLMSKRSFNRLNKEQQDALTNAGKKSEDYFNKATKGLDDEMVATFKKNNVEVVTLTPAEYDAWVKIAQESSYKQFAAEVPDGKKLIDEAFGQIMPDHKAGGRRRPACDERGQRGTRSVRPRTRCSSDLRRVAAALTYQVGSSADGICPIRAQPPRSGRLTSSPASLRHFHRQSVPAAQPRHVNVDVLPLYLAEGRYRLPSRPC
jgi:TRAP-type C4-dicarboxylate transport system substrate-binding protein